MKIFFLPLLLISIVSHCQRRSSGTVTKNDFIGTWTLTKLADKHLDYLSTKVENKTIRFTDDSVFVNVEGKEYSGSWKLDDAQPNISISGTNQFNYQWRAKNDDDIFFTNDNGQHFEYFVRSKNYTERIKGEWVLLSDTNSHIVYTDKEEKAYYGKSLMAKYNYQIKADSLSAVDQSNNEPYDWLIITLNNDKLTLKHIRTGHILYMRRKREKVK